MIYLDDVKAWINDDFRIYAPYLVLVGTLVVGGFLYKEFKEVRDTVDPVLHDIRSIDQAEEQTIKNNKDKEVVTYSPLQVDGRVLLL